MIWTMADPQTPPPNLASERELFDSPFSDYHTDSSRSSTAMSSSPQKDLLRRLNHITDMVQRGEYPLRVTRAMQSKLDAVEALLAAPDPQSRLHLEDSGLFLEDDEWKPREENYEDNHVEVHLDDIPEEGVCEEQDYNADSLMTFDLADRIARNVEEHMDYMNQLLDQAKQREQELEQYMDDIQSSKDHLIERFAEVKRNNTAAIENIHILQRQVSSLRTVNEMMEERLHDVEDQNLHLQEEVTNLKAASGALDHDTDDTVAETCETKSPISKWSAFWHALSDASGMIDYEELLHND